ncbi:MAG: hypothetical protein AUG51_23150 [Acidobacteria bacterium 13_1_20CM_3_53_8]|nr:MAG: hypothetical protein AUG51_23150 [Acidobacteria bacterium 13_1_20CM_3_53_8]
MEDQEQKTNVSFEIRVSPGRKGNDPNEPDWEVAEMEDGEVKNSSDVYDNLTLEEAKQMADMWTRKKDEAEAEG